MQFVLGIFAAMIITNNASLKEYNTFGMDVKADAVVEWASELELKAVLPELERPILAIGQGSNLLFMDDFHGTVLKSAIQGIDILDITSDYVTVKVGSGIPWDDFVTYCVLKGWWGVENLAAIPGQVGAAAVQNIGAYGAQADQVIDTVIAVSLQDGSVREFTCEECQYAYRQSIFKNELKGQYAISHVIFTLGLKPSPKLGYGNLEHEVSLLGEASPINISKAVRSIRQSKLPDPQVLGNAGSFFMNPTVTRAQYDGLTERYPDMPSYSTPNPEMVKIPAGWLIEKAGWKGRSMGKAAVHDRQALVLVNLGGATGQDIMALAKAVTESVYDMFSINLSMEVNCI